jgi:PGF-CTERM protein/PGF-pre-PGF domain-containing protein
VSITVTGATSQDASVTELQSFDASVPQTPGTFLTGLEITVPERVRDNSGSFQLTIDQSRLQGRGVDAQDLQVYKYDPNSNNWNAAATDVVSSSNEEVVLEIEVDSYSLFAVSTQPAQTTTTPIGTATPSGTATATATPSEPGTSQPSTPTDMATATPRQTTEAPLPGFGPLVAVLALVTAGFLLRQRT